MKYVVVEKKKRIVPDSIPTFFGIRVVHNEHIIHVKLTYIGCFCVSAESGGVLQMKDDSALLCTVVIRETIL